MGLSCLYGWGWGTEDSGKVNAFSLQCPSRALKDMEKMTVDLSCRDQLAQETVVYRKQNA